MTTIIRKAVPSDIPLLVKMGLEALERDKYDKLLICKDKVEAMALDCVSAATNFVGLQRKTAS